MNLLTRKTLIQASYTWAKLVLKLTFNMAFSDNLNNIPYPYQDINWLITLKKNSRCWLQYEHDGSEHFGRTGRQI